MRNAGIHKNSCIFIFNSLLFFGYDWRIFYSLKISLKDFITNHAFGSNFTYPFHVNHVYVQWRWQLGSWIW